MRDGRETERRIEELLGQMTLEEKVSLVAGVDTWHTAAVPRLGVPAIKLTDGPHGARGERTSDGKTSASFPCGSAMGATWSPGLIEEVGRALGEETRSKGAHVLLGPTVNIHRSPLAGRNFECYAEDPILTARLAVAYIQGVQSQGVGACIKHFVCNESEFQRHTISSEVAERALREIYLRPFETAIEEARPWSLMSAYNKLNGTWCSENDRLLNRILKREWAFDGFVVSDWFGTNSTAAVANGGLDLEMPGPARHLGDKLLEAVKQGQVPETTLDDKVRRLLRGTFRMGAFDSPEERPEEAVDRLEHRALARRVARESMVLLKNEDAVLPLDVERIERLAMIGPNAHPRVVMGGGSSRVTPHYTVTPLEGVRARCADRVQVAHELGCTNHKRLPVLDAELLEPLDGDEECRLRIDYFDNLELAGEPVVTQSARRAEFSWFGSAAPGLDGSRFSARCVASIDPPESGLYTLGIASAGLSRILVDGKPVVDNWSRWERGDTFYGAGSTEVSALIEMRAGERRRLEIEYSKEGSPLAGGFRVGLLLPVPEDAMDRAVRAARSADATIVVVGLDGDWETEGHDRVDMELPGRQAELIEKVSAANRRTVVVLNAGSPLRLEDWIDGVPAVLQAWYGGQEFGNALAELVFGEESPSGKLPTTFPKRIEDNPAYLNYPGESGQVHYGEGIFVGYRYYDTRRIEPLFPFGHGLSYTVFDYGELRLERAEIRESEVLHASIEVRNAGERAGQETMQIYIRDLESSVSRPMKELAAFAKLELAPGQSETLRFELRSRDLAFWDPRQSKWVAEPGEFELLAGSSSRDIRARARFTLRAG